MVLRLSRGSCDLLDLVIVWRKPESARTSMEDLRLSRSVWIQSIRFIREDALCRTGSSANGTHLSRIYGGNVNGNLSQSFCLPDPTVYCAVPSKGGRSYERNIRRASDVVSELADGTRCPGSPSKPFKQVAAKFSDHREAERCLKCVSKGRFGF
jgi:hypothetical protein